MTFTGQGTCVRSPLFAARAVLLQVFEYTHGHGVWLLPSATIISFFISKGSRQRSLKEHGGPSRVDDRVNQGPLYQISILRKRLGLSSSEQMLRSIP